MIDPTLDGNFLSEEVTRYIHIGLLCIQVHARKKRPTMSTVVSASSGYHVALSTPEPPFRGPTTIIQRSHQKEGLRSSNRHLNYNDYISEICPR
ncbi:Cysteine-rich receptor-like protein kinase 18 [Bienertia sinuspersici]